MSVALYSLIIWVHYCVQQ